jgi:hypothetical protein
MAKIGRSYPVAGTARALLETAGAGFVDVHEIVYKQPLRPWPRDKKSAPPFLPPSSRSPI